MDVYSKYLLLGMKIIDNRDILIKNHVVIFDIDDTIIDINGNIIESIYKLYQYALENNIYIVFITAREGTEVNKKLTMEQLKHHKIKYDLLYFLPPYMRNEKYEIIEKYKFYARKNVTECGYKTLFSIGDNLWDVSSKWENNNEYCGISILLEK